jgi:hypothetical protein
MPPINDQSSAATARSDSPVIHKLQIIELNDDGRLWKAKDRKNEVNGVSAKPSVSGYCSDLLPSWVYGESGTTSHYLSVSDFAGICQ